MTDKETATTTGKEAGTFGRILVGVDGSDLSLSALRRAVKLARESGSRVKVVTTWDYPVLSADTAPDVGRLDVAAEQAQAEALATVFGTDVPSFVDAELIRGGAARVMAEESKQADLVVVGSRGHGGFTGMLIGSVSLACAQHAKCDVLIVRK